MVPRLYIPFGLLTAVLLSACSERLAHVGEEATPASDTTLSGRSIADSLGAAHPPSPVRDRSTGGGWSGTVQVVVNTSGTVVENPPETGYGGSTYTLTRSLTATLQFTNGVGHWQAEERSTWDGKGHCIFEPRNTSSTLEGSGPAWMEIGEEQPEEEDIREDDERGTAVVGFAYDPVRTAVGITGLRLRGQESGTVTECDENLRPVRIAVSGEASMDYFPLGTVYGKMPDPRDASELSGTFTSPVEDALSGLMGTMTVTWNLRRE